MRNWYHCNDNSLDLWFVTIPAYDGFILQICLLILFVTYFLYILVSDFDDCNLQAETKNQGRAEDPRTPEHSGLSQPQNSSGIES